MIPFSLGYQIIQATLSFSSLLSQARTTLIENDAFSDVTILRRDARRLIGLYAIMRLHLSCSRRSRFRQGSRQLTKFRGLEPPSTLCLLVDVPVWCAAILAG